MCARLELLRRTPTVFMARRPSYPGQREAGQLHTAWAEPPRPGTRRSQTAPDRRERTPPPGRERTPRWQIPGRHTPPPEGFALPQRVQKGQTNVPAADRRGRPGSPAPVPTSTTDLPAKSVRFKRVQAVKWSRATSLGSVMAVRFITSWSSGAGCSYCSKTASQSSGRESAAQLRCQHVFHGYPPCLVPFDIYLPWESHLTPVRKALSPDRESTDLRREWAAVRDAPEEMRRAGSEIRASITAARARVKGLVPRKVPVASTPARIPGQIQGGKIASACSGVA